MQTENPPLFAPRLAPETDIPGAPSLTLGSFWTWAYSDVLSNRNRAIYAEFLVGAALGVVTDGVRTEWDACDLHYEGKRIEVKSAAFVQSWKQSRLSPIRFDVSEKKPWIAKTNEYKTDPCRYSDFYVFCLMTAIDDAFQRVLDVASWEFYVVATSLIDQRLGPVKSLSLAKLRGLRHAVAFSELRAEIDSACAAF